MPKPEASEIKLSREELSRLLQAAGGEAGLSAILQDFYQRMSEDLLIGFFFAGKDLSRIAETQKAFLLRSMGATRTYAGKAPAQAHTELPPILAGHFDRRLRILEETLVAHGLDDKDIRIWIAFESAFRPGIVTG